MAQAKLVVSVDNIDEIKNGIDLLGHLLTRFPTETAEAVDVPVVVVEEEEEVVEELVADEVVAGGDDLADLMADEPESTEPTVDDIKVAFKALAAAKGKEGALSIIHNIFKRLNVKKMEEIEGEKIPVVIQVLEKAAAAE